MRDLHSGRKGALLVMNSSLRCSGWTMLFPRPPEVVLRDDKKGGITEYELLACCKGNVTHNKVPRYIEFRDEIPKSIIGKVLRRELREDDPIWIAAKENH